MTSGNEGMRFSPDLNRVSGLDEKNCRSLLQRVLKEHDRKEIYPIGETIDVPAGNDIGMDPGLYSLTNFTTEELGQGELLAVSHCTILMIKLAERLKPEQKLSITPYEGFATKEGYAILQIKIGSDLS